MEEVRKLFEREMVLTPALRQLRLRIKIDWYKEHLDRLNIANLPKLHPHLVFVKKTPDLAPVNWR